MKRKITYWEILLTVFFVMITVLTSGQETASMQLTEEELRSRIESIAENADAEIDYTELLEGLRYYLQHPLNLNFATTEELSGLVFLNEIQIYHIIAYRETYGYFASIYELNAVEGMDPQTIQSVLPFVEVSQVETKPDMSVKNIFKWGRHEGVARYQQILQTKSGYKPVSDSAWIEKPGSYYLGSPEKIYFRYGFNSMNRVRAGVTLEKDPGEPVSTSMIPDSIRSLAGDNLKNGFDFFSLHAGVYDIGFLKALSLGDYQLRFGQGLTMWSGLAFGKSTGAVDIKKTGNGVSPYTSSDENRYFRGAAATVEFGNVEVTTFYSSNRIDASTEVADTFEMNAYFISNLQESGLHRTPTEIQKKKELEMTVYGGNLNIRKNRFSAGVTAATTRFDQVVDLSGELYNSFYFNGYENFNGGVDYSYLTGDFSFFGEAAISKNGGWAFLQGMTANLHPRLYFSLLYRNYRKEYQNFFSNPFSESDSFNEEGLYAGLRFSMASRWLLTAYTDFFRYPWLRYYVDQPSYGSDYYIQLEHNVNREVDLYIRVRQKNVPQNLQTDSPHLGITAHYRKTSARFHIDYRITEKLGMKNRAEALFYNEGEYAGSGFLVFHDINWIVRKNLLNLYLRYALFDTDSYDERIYAYENDMLYAFSVPAYYYKGSKIYLMMRLNVGEKVSFWARLSHIVLENKSQFGSGTELIDDHRKSEVKFQVLVKL